MAFKETVRSVLKTKGGAVWSVSPETSVFNALIMMADKDVGALIVVSEGRLVGMFSERDYARKIILHGKSSRDTLVQEVMTSQVVTVTPEQNVQECMRIMTNHRIRHLPVLDGDRLIKVDGLEIIPSVKNDDIQAAIRGPVGQKVKITIGHSPDYTPVELSIARSPSPKRLFRFSVLIVDSDLVSRGIRHIELS